MRKIIDKFYLVLIFIFLYAPIVTLMVFSFNDSKLKGKWAGFTLRWYKNLFTDPTILEALKNTLIVALIATVVATVLGTIAAIGINELRGFKKSMLLDVNYLPVLNPDIVTAVSLMGLFGFLHLRFGLLTMTISHIVFCTPYVILSVLPKLGQMDKNTVEAALDLGATPSQVITKVIIPQIRPGIVTGALMAFTLSLDDFVVSYFNTGHGVSNLSITIYAMARKGINPSINAMSTIMFIALLILLLIINRNPGNRENINF
ncbi:ABC transporter permease [Peptoniphilus indolicus]|uniref:Spermidine/putrescine ABC superfamily ATP binding cassette transporter, permease protein n=2 Tax=Peptoniphilus indolicus TaxID=33030 RepID=G4D5B1_9FIRM|nr:ABC transporter permease [Peptoniphilus indolicus]EGY79227.1 spermidine/putrescine ABC superfamily ATP binding cassette transporter, permease protein [Peptoniphilus indolicus ATCC 29427]SUB74329.1 Inner membrane ABC transporter permease protein ydcV [Peptoniphilus indolicus]